MGHLREVDERFDRRVATTTGRKRRVNERRTRRMTDAISRSRAIAPVVTMHSSEVSTEGLRVTFRGFDRRQVEDRMDATAASYAALEQEVERLRDAWDELLIALAGAGKRRSDGSFDRGALDLIARRMMAARPPTGVPLAAAPLARGGLTEARRSRASMRLAVREANVQVARLQRAAALLERSNEELRTRLIELLAEE